jgi:triacylglycerol lipase
MNIPVPNVFDPQTAGALVEFAAGAYGAMDNGQLIIDNEATDTRVVVCQNERELVVAFRGTADLRNWLTDLDARFRGDFGCRVHAGFSAALDGVQGRLLAAIAGTTKRIWITGHSLGGALAMLWAWRIANLKFQISKSLAGVYTFGQPRVGDAGFRDCYDGLLKERTFRVVDGEDFITRIPWLLGAYRHCGTEVFYDSLGQAGKGNQRCVRDLGGMEPGGTGCVAGGSPCEQIPGAV